MRAVPESESNVDPQETAGPDALARDGARALEHSPHRDGAISALLSSARHELRSPLQSIQGFAELLGSQSYGSLSEEQHIFVQHILQGSVELNTIVEACLELTEVELIGRAVEPTRTDLQTALTDALDPLRNGTSTIVNMQFGATTHGARMRFDRDVLRRALHALLTAMSAGLHKTFRATVEVSGDLGCLLLTRAPSTSTASRSSRSAAADAGPNVPADKSLTVSPEGVLSRSGESISPQRPPARQALCLQSTSWPSGNA